AVPLARTQHGPRESEPRRNLVAPAEADRVLDLRPKVALRVRRKELVLEASANVQGHVRAKLPCVLNIETLVAAVDLRVVANAVLPDVVAVSAALVDSASARETLSPEDVELAVEVVILDVIGQAVERVARLQGVLLAEGAGDVGPVQVDVMTRCDVTQRRKRAADIREIRSAGKRRRHRRVGLRVTRRPINEVRTGGQTVAPESRRIVTVQGRAFIVKVLVTVAGAQHQLGGRRVGDCRRVSR